MALLPACRVWFFETVITKFGQWETQTAKEEKKETKKAGHTPTEFIQNNLQREEVFWFHGKTKT